MKDTIYTIPVTEAFEKKCGCPMCTLYDMLEAREIEAITGASMMEPDVRIRTNQQGFCEKHFKQMLGQNAKLSVALILESHVAEIKKNLEKAEPGKKDAKQTAEITHTQNNSCYVCQRIDGFLEKICETIYYLWKKEPEFQQIFLEQEYFCLPHFEMLLRYAPKNFLLGKGLSAFNHALYQKELSYLDRLGEDLNWFTKKYDYRNKDAEWKNAKDSVERAIYFLSGRK